MQNENLVIWGVWRGFGLSIVGYSQVGVFIDVVPLKHKTRASPLIPTR